MKGEKLIILSDMGKGPGKDRQKIQIKDLGIWIHPIDGFLDNRGALGFLELDTLFPVNPKRIFFIFDVPLNESRGGHAHRECSQFLVCLSGACTVEIDNGTTVQQFRVDTPFYGLELPRMYWSRQFDFTESASLLVLASDHYSEEDYIREYSEYTETLLNSRNIHS